jgi:hypothetical protein
LREPQSLDPQTVHVRRRVVALAVAAHVGIAKVVGQNEDDVRLGRLRKAGATYADPSERQRTRGSRLDKPATANRVPIMRHVFNSMNIWRSILRLPITLLCKPLPA